MEKKKETYHYTLFLSLSLSQLHSFIFYCSSNNAITKHSLFIRVFIVCDDDRRSDSLYPSN